MTKQVSAIVLAAGQGKRMGSRIQKQFLDLGVIQFFITV